MHANQDACMQIKMYHENLDACMQCLCMHAAHAYNQDACMECLCMHVVHVGIQMKMHAMFMHANQDEI